MPKKSSKDSLPKTKTPKKAVAGEIAEPETEPSPDLAVELDEAQQYLAQMQAERGYILGWHKVLATQDLEFLKGYNGLLQAAYTNPRLLDAKTKEMVITAVLMAVRSQPEHITTHLEMCKKLGVTAQEMLEVLEVVLPPAGVPAFMHSFGLWQQVYNLS